MLRVLLLLRPRRSPQAEFQRALPQLPPCQQPQQLQPVCAERLHLQYPPDPHPPHSHQPDPHPLDPQQSEQQPER